MREMSSEGAGYDIVWFAVDPTGKVVFFSSGGLLIPQSAHNEQEIKMLFNYFLGLPKINSKAVLNPNIKKYQYREDEIFEMMAERGLYAFDRIDETSLYFLYAYPENLITIDDLPTEIAIIVKKTVVGYMKPGDVVLDIENE